MQIVQLHRQLQAAPWPGRRSRDRRRPACRTAASARAWINAGTSSAAPCARRAQEVGEQDVFAANRSDRPRRPAELSRPETIAADAVAQRAGVGQHCRRPAARTSAAPTAAGRFRRRACRSPRRRRRAAARCAPAPGPTRPGRSSRCSAVFAAYGPARSCPCVRFTGIDPRLRSPRGARFGNVSSRLPRSPFGSMQMAGMPSMAASSSSDRHRPVLPLPVMPTHTAWVVRSCES